MSSTATQQKLGLKFGRNGVHSSRTMMLAEISELFHGRPASATAAQYKEDIEVFNVLHKPTEKSRQLTWRHLVDLYGMDTDIPLFRVFRRLWTAMSPLEPYWPASTYTTQSTSRLTSTRTLRLCTLVRYKDSTAWTRTAMAI